MIACERLLINSLLCCREEGHRGAHEDRQGHTNEWYRKHPQVHMAGIAHHRNIPANDTFASFPDEVTCLFCLDEGIRIRFFFRDVR